MEPKTITSKTLQKVFEVLKKGSDDARGNYLFKDFRIQISKYKASGAERTSRLYHKRREQGLCIRCGVKVVSSNPKTGKLYRLCDHHRNLIDRKTPEEEAKEKTKKKAGKAKTTASKTKTTKSKTTAKKSRRTKAS